MTETFSTYSLAGELSLFQGPEEMRDLIARYIELKEQVAHREGFKAALNEIKSSANRDVNNYVGLVTKVIYTVQKAVASVFSDEPVKIVEARTNFDFASLFINILFIVDVPFEKEIELQKILNDVRRIVLEQENHIAEIFFVNTRTNPNLEFIRSDYPYMKNENAKS